MVKKKILFFGRQNEEPKSGYGSAKLLVDSITSQFDPKIYDLYMTNYEDLVFTIDGKEAAIIDTLNGLDLREYSFVFLRTWFSGLGEEALSIANYLNKFNIPFMNSEALSNRSRTKLSQYFMTWRAELPLPKTIYGSHDKLKEAIISKQPYVDYPFIMKCRVGARGEDNYRVSDEAEFVKLLDENTDTKFLIQEYIPNKCDYRLLVADESVRLIIKRQRKNDNTHLNNTSKDADSELVDVVSFPKSACDGAIKLSRIFGREITGVDVVLDDRDKSKYYFLEINNMPQLEKGSFVPEKMQVLADAIKSRVKGS